MGYPGDGPAPTLYPSNRRCSREVAMGYPLTCLVEVFSEVRNSSTCYTQRRAIAL
jgi:hypothetical protein